jgi:hypothetical protein
MGNHLALFDLIRKRSDNKAEIETALYDLARRIGISHDDINDALDSDRGLVIYEP